ncbi:hypothetical protein UT300010_06950 [Clostridium perfringens]
MKRLKSLDFQRVKCFLIAILNRYEEMVNIIVNSDISVKLVERILLILQTPQHIEVRNPYISGLNMINT